MDVYAATIGFFDGVHLGHQYLLRQLQSHATAHGMKTMAITFDRHPRQVLQPGWKPQLLTTPDEKAALLTQTGIDRLVVLHFDQAVANLTARQFMTTVLRDQLSVGLLLTGYDNRFGHDRTETFDDYVRYGQELGIKVVAANVHTSTSPHLHNSTPPHLPTSSPPQLHNSTTYSSTLIRNLLSDGHVETAAQCIGRLYSITGHVVHGQRKGHALGFPTANLMPDDPLKLIPAKGVYAVEAITDDGTPHHAMTNIGTRPTFGGEQQTLETNIFDPIGDIYGQPLTIRFVERLRDEVPFPSQQALAAQLSRDRQMAQHILHNGLIQ